MFPVESKTMRIYVIDNIVSASRALSSSSIARVSTQSQYPCNWSFISNYLNFKWNYLYTFIMNMQKKQTNQRLHNIVNKYQPSNIVYKLRSIIFITELFKWNFFVVSRTSIELPSSSSSSSNSSSCSGSVMHASLSCSTIDATIHIRPLAESAILQIISNVHFVFLVDLLLFRMFNMLMIVNFASESMHQRHIVIMFLSRSLLNSLLDPFFVVVCRACELWLMQARLSVNL